MTAVLSRVDELVRRFSAPEFGRLYNTLADLSAMLYEAASRKTLVNLRDVADLHPRTAALLALRLKDEARAAMHARFLQSYRGNDPTLLRARSDWELPAAFENEAMWDDTLALIRRAYKAVGWSREVDPSFPGRQREGTVIPEHVARKIVDDCLAYPTELVRIAEVRLRSIAMSGVTPVGEVAEHERWFG